MMFISETFGFTRAETTVDPMFSLWWTVIIMYWPVFILALVESWGSWRRYRKGGSNPQNVSHLVVISCWAMVSSIWLRITFDEFAGLAPLIYLMMQSSAALVLLGLFDSIQALAERRPGYLSARVLFIIGLVFCDQAYFLYMASPLVSHYALERGLFAYYAVEVFKHLFYPVVLLIGLRLLGSRFKWLRTGMGAVGIMAWAFVSLPSVNLLSSCASPLQPQIELLFFQSSFVLAILGLIYILVYWQKQGGFSRGFPVPLLFPGLVYLILTYLIFIFSWIGANNN